jgi:hypothetical protein
VEERVSGMPDEIPAPVEGRDGGFIRRSSNSFKRMYFPRIKGIVADVLEYGV